MRHKRVNSLEIISITKATTMYLVPHLIHYTYLSSSLSSYLLFLKSTVQEVETRGWRTVGRVGVNNKEKEFTVVLNGRHSPPLRYSLSAGSVEFGDRSV